MINTWFTKSKLAISIVIIIISFLFSVNYVLAADDFGLNKTAETAFSKLPNATETEPAYIVGSVIGVVLSFLGVIFFGLILYGGFIWMFAQGNEEQIKKARGIILSAAVGVVIVLAAYTVTYFITKAGFEAIGLKYTPPSP